MLPFFIKKEKSLSAYMSSRLTSWVILLLEVRPVLSLSMFFANTRWWTLASWEAEQASKKALEVQMQKNLEDRKARSNMLTIDITAVAEAQSRNEQLKHLHKSNKMVEENIETALTKAFGKWWRGTMRRSPFFTKKYISIDFKDQRCFNIFKLANCFFRFKGSYAKIAKCTICWRTERTRRVQTF